MVMSGREIADVLGQRSHDGVRKSLARLVAQGIVRREVAGNALMHTLNRDHVGAPAVMALAAMRAELWGRLRRSIGEWDPPAAHASVFGSAARGDGTAASDIDLLIVRPDGVDHEDPRWHEQIDELAMRVREWTGNPASIVEQAEHDIRTVAAGGGRPILADLRCDGIDLAGEPLRSLLGTDVR